MTLKCTTRDEGGRPVGGILIRATCLQTGQSYPRSSDGNGYSDVAMIGVPAGLDVLIEVIKEGYAVYTKYLKTTVMDQEVSIVLTPFL